MKKIFFITTLLTLACKRDNINNATMDQSISHDTVSIIFPEVIESNNEVNGEVFYNFDEYNKIKNDIGRGKISRYIHLYTSVDTFSIDAPQYFNSIKKDTFLTQNINKINFKIRVNNRGKYFINALIKDIVIFDTLRKDLNSPAKISEVIISKEITVK